jgi:pimeloyl-ACP methyl ester carboxylesterase/1-acyl-sn-glycerol-3-phosphate acyltransferase
MVSADSGLAFVKGLVSTFLLTTQSSKSSMLVPPHSFDSPLISLVPTLQPQRRPWSSLLFAASSTVEEDEQRQRQEKTTFTRYSDLSSTFKDLYKELDNASFYVQKTPTIKFCFVEPPPQSSGEKVIDENGENAFISDHYNATSVFEQVHDLYCTSADDDDDDTRPIVVYLPGLDCAGISASAQFDDLSMVFEMWRLTVSTTDRTSLSGLVKQVVEFIQQLSQTRQNRRVILIGESFGGLLAPLVALQLQQKQTRHQVMQEQEQQQEPQPQPILQGMVLVNPATSFQFTAWDQLGPFLSMLGNGDNGNKATSDSSNPITPYTVVGGVVLSTLVPDAKQVQQIGQTLLDVTTKSFFGSNSDDAATPNPLDIIKDMQQAMTDGFGSLATTLPPDLVLHRVREWMVVGSQLLTESRLRQIEVPTLVVVGSQDAFLPSRDEVKRLERLLPNISKPSLIVPDAGHFVLDGRVNLTEAIVYNIDMDPLNLLIPNYDPIVDWKIPSPNRIQHTINNQVKPLRRFTSPVFFSTDADGKRHKGLGQLPSSSPLIIVANHQLFGLDLGLVLAELYEQRQIWARGLAHPVVSSRLDKSLQMPNRPLSPGLVEKPKNVRGGGGDPSNPSTFQEFGAVMVTPRNYYKLLQTGQNVLLFPGGVREVFHGKDEAYKLFWPETPDFVRTAARFNATIVPLAGIGAADSVDILIDGPDMTKSARYDNTNDDELFVPPFFVPKLPPARHYFCFGKPFVTTNIDPKNITQCEGIYKDIKTELERGLEDLQTARESDPYKDSVARLALEQASGKPAPTFPVDQLNR